MLNTCQTYESIFIAALKLRTVLCNFPESSLDNCAGFVLDMISEEENICQNSVLHPAFFNKLIKETLFTTARYLFWQICLLGVLLVFERDINILPITNYFQYFSKFLYGSYWEH